MKLSNISRSISNKIIRNISHKIHETPTRLLNSGSTGPFFDYYVDSVGGNNANDGTSPAKAKQTIAAAQALLSAGKSLGLCRGSTWAEIFTFQHANISIGVYGDENDDPPVFDGRDTATGWTQHNAGTYPDVWNVSWTRSQVASTGSVWVNLWEDNEFVRAATSIADCQTNGGAFYASRTATTTTVYIKSTTNPNSNGKTYKISKRGWAFKGHKTPLGVDAPLNQQIVGPIECVGFIEHYNAIAGGPGQIRQALLTDGNIHHTVTEGDLCEDVYMARVIPGLTASLHTAYRIVGTGFSHIARRCLAIAAGGTARVSHGGFYTHASTPTTTDSFLVDQCIARSCAIAGDTQALTITNFYCVEACLPTISAGSSNVTLDINRVQIQDLTAAATAEMALRCLTAAPVITVDNFCARILFGAGITITGSPSTPPSFNRSAIVTVSGGITGGSGALQATLTLNNSIVTSSGGRVLNLIISPYVGDYNVFQGNGTASTAPVFSINGTVDSSLSAWQTRTGQDTNSVWLKGLDQTAGNANAFWLGVSTNANAGPADGDWRINPSAKVYNGAGTAFFGTFADGVTPITEAGPQEHWNYNTRSVVAGPPTRLLTLPATKAEERQYINDPTAWDFYA